MSEKQMECPWCNEQVVPKVNLSSNQYGSVKERKCPKCNKLLAAYLSEEGDVLEKVRTFQG